MLLRSSLSLIAISAICSSAAFAEAPSAPIPPAVTQQNAEAIKQAALQQGDQALKAAQAQTEAALRDAQQQMLNAQAQVNANRGNLSPEQQAQIDAAMASAKNQLNQAQVDSQQQLQGSRAALGGAQAPGTSK